MIAEAPMSAEKHVPTVKTRMQVEKMAACGIEQALMADFLQITKTTLQTHYRREIDLGLAQANMRVAGRLYNIALYSEAEGHAVQACTFWLKTRGKGQFSETIKTEMSGPNGQPIETANTTTNFDGGPLTDEERVTRVLQILNAGATRGD